MTTVVEICNRALSEMGTQSTIVALDEGSPEANQCALWYNTLRKQLLRTAPWGFARRTTYLTMLGNLEQGTSPYPSLFKYAYPADCLKFRYTIPPPAPTGYPVAPQVGIGGIAPLWCGPSRQYRFLVNSDVDADGHATKTLLSNVPGAIGIYTMDVTNPDMFDDLFQGALTAALSYKLVIPLAGDSGMREQFAKSAQDSILQARVVDGNEAIPSSDHSVDWITTRGVGSVYGYGNYGSGWGDYYGFNESMNWGM